MFFSLVSKLKCKQSCLSSRAHLQTWLDEIKLFIHKTSFKSSWRKCVCKVCVWCARVNPKTFSNYQLIVTEVKGDLGVTDAEGNVIIGSKSRRTTASEKKAVGHWEEHAEERG